VESASPKEMAGENGEADPMIVDMEDIIFPEWSGG